MLRSLLIGSTRGYTLARAFSNQFSPKVIFVLGLPGSGKGTHSKKLVEDYGVFHISAGDLLRKAIEEKHTYAKQIDETIKSGRILPAHITLQLIQEAITKKQAPLTLLDGYPRNQDNYEAWFKQMNNVIDVAGVLVYESNLKDLQRRILERGKSSHRSDDNLDSLQKRFEIYEKETKPVIEKLSSDYPTFYVNTYLPFEEAYKSTKQSFEEICKKNNVHF